MKKQLKRGVTQRGERFVASIYDKELAQGREIGVYDTEEEAHAAFMNELY